MDHASPAHLLTAAAYLVIGWIMVMVAVRIWWTHPINRAFVFGPYLTEAGIRILLRHWPFMFLFGAFILSCALDHAADWASAVHLLPAVVTPSLQSVLANGEATISIATAIAVLWVAVRSCKS